MRDQTRAIRAEAVEVVLEENLEPPVNRHDGEMRVACLLEPLEEERSIVVGLEDVGVEVVAFDPRGVGQNNLADAERGHLCPQSLHHFRTGQREQQVDGWPDRYRVERAFQRDRVRVEGEDRAGAEPTINHPGAHLVSWLNPQHVPQVTGAPGGHDGRTVRPDLRGLEQQQVHVAGRRYTLNLKSSTSPSATTYSLPSMR